MAPSRGWQWDRNAFTVIFDIHPQFQAIVRACWSKFVKFLFFEKQCLPRTRKELCLIGILKLAYSSNTYLCFWRRISAHVVFKLTEISFVFRHLLFKQWRTNWYHCSRNIHHVIPYNNGPSRFYSGMLGSMPSHRGYVLGTLIWKIGLDRATRRCNEPILKPAIGGHLEKTTQSSVFVS